MNKIAKTVLKSSPLIVLFVAVLCIMIYTIYLRINATSIGGGIGAGTGTVVGKAIGSLEGMTLGRAKGTEAGKQAGLSAEDTKARIASDIHEMENLEVLVASVKMSDFHAIGGDNKAYAALYLANGNVVFTVDMSQAQIEEGDDGLHILLPGPKGTLYIDDSSVEKVAEYQRKLFNGSAEDGFDAYLNTMRKMQQASEETLSNYDFLLNSARQSAERQVKLIVKAVSTSNSDVLIEWGD